MPVRPLTRSRADRKIAGVCVGLAAYLEVDVVLVRAAWACLSIVPGVLVGGVVVYAAAWILMPESTDLMVPPQVRQIRRSASDKKVAGICGGVADYYGVDATAVRLLWVAVSVVAGAVIGGVIAYLVAWLIIPAPTERLSPVAAV